MNTQTRSISTIAHEIEKRWQKVHFSAAPYLSAMKTLTSIDDRYGFDDARSIILYFLGNASTFRGEDARRLKQELKTIIK